MKIIYLSCIGLGLSILISCSKTSDPNTNSSSQEDFGYWKVRNKTYKSISTILVGDVRIAASTENSNANMQIYFTKKPNAGNFIVKSPSELAGDNECSIYYVDENKNTFLSESNSQTVKVEKLGTVYTVSFVNINTTGLCLADSCSRISESIPGIALEANLKTR